MKMLRFIGGVATLYSVYSILFLVLQQTNLFDYPVQPMILLILAILSKLIKRRKANQVSTQ